MVRKDTWKGVDEDAIEGMSMEEFLSKTSARNRRSLRRLKNNPRLKKLIERVRRIKRNYPKKVVKTQLRDAVILPEWVGLTFGVYNGKEYKKVEITVTKVGRRLGDFVHSTGRVLHSGPGVGATRGSKFVPLK